MKPTCTRLLLLLLLIFSAGCGSNTEPTRNIDFIPLKFIEITSQNPRAAAGTTNQFTAIGHYGDPTTFQFTRDITSQVTWSSSNTAVLTFSNPSAPGLATTVTAGDARVTATFDNTIHTDLPFTVTTATLTSLVIPPPASTSLFVGETLQLGATGTFTDKSTQTLTDTVTWSSSNPTVATVTTTPADAGLVKALAVGTTTISVSLGTVSATQTLTVTAASLASLAVTSAGVNNSLAMGTSMRLIAKGTYTDASTKDLTSQVAWTSSNSAVATIDQNVGTKGRLKSVTIGSTTVTASLEGVTSPGFLVTVSSVTLTSLAITPTAPTLTIGQTSPLTATGTFSNGSTQDVTSDVVWSSGDAAIATVSMSTGVEGTVKGNVAGTVTITATSGNIPTAGPAITATTQVIVQ